MEWQGWHSPNAKMGVHMTPQGTVVQGPGHIIHPDGISPWQTQLATEATQF